MSSNLYLRLMLLAQAFLAAQGLRQSYNAVNNLQKYEDTAKKAAEWSNEAAHQLHKTRTTQTSGAVAVRLSSSRIVSHDTDSSQVLTSFLASLSLAAFAPYLPPWLRFSTSPALLLGTLFARNHLKNYWAPGDKKSVGTRIPLPGMNDYNEAQRSTEELLQTLEYLEYGWVGNSFVAGMLGWK
ncbi:hypothetical protein Tdes44962_MAKER01271 [Teratosphaeria destructans]|uniref:Uncharacterized protein n=1 Tax=Teratosphaeria destructans TaxID=418781 RepID=A0A9W7T1D1_9PEZI|nr:hypothetical protein Tdes44962_MAKER01271 [Teratosphaeria destructans]